MTKHISVNKIKATLFFVFISILVALRPESVGADSAGYAGAFVSASTEDGIGAPRWEIGFRLFMELVGLFTSSAAVFFFFVALLISMLLYSTYKATSIGHSLRDDIIFVSLLLFSGWYITEMTNGIRQGLALSILYWALMTQFKSERYLSFIFFFLIAVSFHLSVIFTLPFLVLMRFNVKKVSVMWFLALFFYALGINEKLIEGISTALKLEIYDLIKYYSLASEHELGSARWVGLQWDQFIYTVFFGVVAMLVCLRNGRDAWERSSYIFVLKAYLVLSMAYFVFGFGPYSNRYAVMAWFFLPILQTAVVSGIRVKTADMNMLAPVLFMVAATYFMLWRLDWVSYVT